LYKKEGEKSTVEHFQEIKNAADLRKQKYDKRRSRNEKSMFLESCQKLYTKQCGFMVV